MPANGRRGRPQGKCHRKQTAAVSATARVKGWGKSPPRDWQQERQGKPHREQNRIGAVRGETFEGCFRLTVRVGCVRRMATCAQDEWPPRSRREARAIQNPAYRPAGNFSPHGDSDRKSKGCAGRRSFGFSVRVPAPSAGIDSFNCRPCPTTPRSPAKAPRPARNPPTGARSPAARRRRASSAARPRCARRRRKSPIQSARNCR